MTKPKRDQATNDIIKLIPYDAIVAIARSLERDDLHYEELKSAHSGVIPITRLAENFVWQIIYSKLSHYIPTEDEET